MEKLYVGCFKLLHIGFIGETGDYIG